MVAARPRAPRRALPGRGTAGGHQKRARGVAGAASPATAEVEKAPHRARSLSAEAKFLAICIISAGGEDCGRADCGKRAFWRVGGAQLLGAGCHAPRLYRRAPVNFFESCRRGAARNHFGAGREATLPSRPRSPVPQANNPHPSCSHTPADDGLQELQRARVDCGMHGWPARLSAPCPASPQPCNCISHAFDNTRARGVRRHRCRNGSAAAAARELCVARILQRAPGCALVENLLWREEGPRLGAAGGACLRLACDSHGQAAVNQGAADRG
jgi:hypothetical protein